ncbi:MAG TPA: hypothetical protein VKP88_04370, partial [Candidatus Paceibacterota bacterium]|nr:hypothetical protein [Candidatus Paceibacterota bacterium]
MNEEHDATTEIEVTGTDEEAVVPIFSQLSILAVILFLLVGAGIAPRLFSSVTPAATPAAIPPRSLEATPTPPDVSAYADVQLQATAAFVWDIRDQRALYQKAPDESLPLAS